MKKGYNRGVVSCDPGVCGLAFTIYIPSLKFCKSLLFNLKDRLPEGKKVKNILQPKHYVPLLVDLMWDLKYYEHSLSFCDKLIIETQFQQNMKLLVMNICTTFQCLFPWMKIEYISPLACKRKFGVEYGEGHLSNKKKMLQYVMNHKNELIAGDTVRDHNTADSIIILNTWLKDKNRHFYTTPEEYASPVMEVYDERGFLTFEMKNVWLKCPMCKYDTGRLLQCSNQDKSPKNYMACFLKCLNKKCGTNAFLGNMKVTVKDNKISSKKCGTWELTKGDNKPKGFTTERESPKFGNKSSRDDDDEDEDEPAYKRRKVEEDDPLQKIVVSLVKDQETLKDTLQELTKKSQEDFAKLFAAFTQGFASPQSPPAPAEKPVSETKAGTKRRAAPKKFNTDIELDD